MGRRASSSATARRSSCCGATQRASAPRSTRDSKWRTANCSRSWTPTTSGPSDKLELQRALLDREPEVDLAFGLAEQFISPDLTPDQRAQLRPPPGPLPAKLKGTMLARRAAFDRVGPFGTEWKVADFIDWHERARSVGLMARIVPEVLLRRRLHESNIGRRRRDDRAEYARVTAESLRRRGGAGRD